jgi:hypothetical protein
VTERDDMSGGRRDYDNPEALEQRMLRAIEERASANRHMIRNEVAEANVSILNALAEIRRDVQGGNLAQVTENARMQASLEELKRDVSDLRALEPRVAHLEQSDRTDHAVEEALTAARQAQEDNQRIAVAAARESRRWSIGTIVSFLGVFGGYLAFFH